MSLVQGLRGFACLLLLVILAAPAAQAEVRVAFWSQDTGEYFPHAFLTLRGYTERGEMVDESFGFTLKSVSPLVLVSDVPGRIDFTEPAYMLKSDVWFEKVVTDSQLARIQSLVSEWGEEGDNTYSLNNRNCIHFVAEAMRRAGLRVETPEELMKKPKSFTKYIQQLNAGKVTAIEMDAPGYYVFLERRDAARLAANDNAPAENLGGAEFRSASQ